MRFKPLLVILIMFLFLLTGCLYAVRYDGPYHGKVVDLETREPIEGAVVVGIWAEYHFGVAGGYTTFHDARETVTDKRGEFTIPGQGLRLMSTVGPMGALIYKAGFTYYRTGSWDTLKTGISKAEVEWDKEVPVFSLRKLSSEERNKYSLPGPPSAPWQKIILMTQEINKERINRGLEPYSLAPEKVGGGK